MTSQGAEKQNKKGAYQVVVKCGQGSEVSLYL